MNFSFSWADLRNYGITLGIFLVIDFIWLTVIAKSLYAQHLGYLMATKSEPARGADLLSAVCDGAAILRAESRAG